MIEDDKLCGGFWIIFISITGLIPAIKDIKALVLAQLTVFALINLLFLSSEMGMFSVTSILNILRLLIFFYVLRIYEYFFGISDENVFYRSNSVSTVHPSIMFDSG